MRIDKNPKRVLRKLTQRYLKNNRLLNLFAISGIVLTCILFTCVFNVVLSVNDSIKSQMIDEIGCSDSGSFDYLTLNQVEKLKQNKKIQSSHFIYSLGVIENKKLNKNFTATTYYFSPEHFKEYKNLKMSSMEGKYPENSNEVMLSTTVLKQLSIEPIIGTEIDLKIAFQEHVLDKKFILSGVYEYNKFEDIQLMFVSDDFINTTNIYKNKAIYFLFVNLKHNINLAEKFIDIMIESGCKKLHIHNLALLNLLRNPKQFLIIIISLSLMPIILNLMITFVCGFDYDSYMSRFVSSDFIAAHVNYFKSEYDGNSVVDEEFIKYIDTIDIKEAGTIYCDKSYGRIVDSNGFERVKEDIFHTQYRNIDYDIDLYGYDDFLLSKFEVIHGELNKDVLKSGTSIIEIIEVDDYNKPDLSTMRFKVGDHIDVYYDNHFVKTYTVVAQVKKISNFAELNGTLEFIARLALPSEEYLKIAPTPHKMSYIFNVPDSKLREIHSRLTEYVKNENESMRFKSKLEFEKQYEEAKNAFLIPGVFCAILVGLIGIINYINVFITSILSRKDEFIILDKIGMIGSQRKMMLILEGVFYTLVSSIAFVIVSSIVNFSALKYVMDQLWLTKYQFNFFSLFLCIPIYLIISIVTPLIIDKVVMKKG